MQQRLKKNFLFLLCLLCSTVLLAQQPAGLHSIKPMDLPITVGETSVLLFPAAIKSVDRGSKDILTKTVKDISNVLKLKAANDSMKPSNMHVFTMDGQIYSFNITYCPKPAHLTIDLTNRLSGQKEQTPVTFTTNRLNDEQVARFAELIAELKPMLYRPHSKRTGDAQLAIRGIYFVKGVLFFQLILINTAPVPYQIDFTRTYIRDKRRSKRTSVTEKEIHPICMQMKNNLAAIQHITLVLAFDQFTIADNKHFDIEVFEQNGDRLLTLKLRGKDILRARRLLQSQSSNTRSE